MISNTVLQQLVERFLQVNDKLDHIQTIPIQIMDGVSISTRVLHILVTIGNYERSNVTFIAEKLGITKGAVSQQIKNLRRANLVQVTYAPDNRKEKLLSLTMKGVKVYQAHGSLHKKLYSEINHNLSQLSSEQQKLILDTLKAVSSSIDKYQEILVQNHEIS